MCFHPGVVDKSNKNCFMGSLEKLIDRFGEKVAKENIKKDNWVLVPCGQCLACRISYAEHWAARCETETHYHEQNVFITLTYDDDHVPVIDYETGEIYKGLKKPLEYFQGQTRERLTVFKPDLQKFWKRLRKATGAKLMYYASGEYGDKTGRPHYHCIIYGLEIPDLELWDERRGYQRFHSKWLDEIWGLGRTEIGSVTYESCRYVARYVIKKRKGKEAKYYEEAKIFPEFVNMSLKPGIGMQYFEDHKDEIYKTDKIYLQGGRTVKPPRYFDKLMDEEQLQRELGEFWSFRDFIEPDEAKTVKVESEFMRDIKDKRRKVVLTKTEARWRATNLSLLEYYKSQEKAFESKNTLAKNRGKIDEQD